jgi:LEA14-like dessication related protein
MTRSGSAGRTGRMRSLAKGGRVRAPLRLLGVALVVIAIGGCALFFRDPSVRILDVRVASLGLTAGSAEVSLEVVNPNRYTLRLRSFDYVLEIQDRSADSGWAELARGSSTDEIPVAGRDTTMVSLDVPFQYRAVQTALSAYLREGRVEYRFRGDARVRGPMGTVQLPFSQRGIFD